MGQHSVIGTVNVPEEIGIPKLVITMSKDNRLTLVTQDCASARISFDCYG